MLRSATSCPAGFLLCVCCSRQPLQQDAVTWLLFHKQHLPAAFSAVVHHSPEVMPPASSPCSLLCDVQLAKQQLETALRSAQRESMLITDSEVAEVHYKLGRICWTMGGNQLTDPTQARAHLVAATQHDSEVQVRSLHAICQCRLECIRPMQPYKPRHRSV